MMLFKATQFSKREMDNVKCQQSTKESSVMKEVPTFEDEIKGYESFL